MLQKRKTKKLVIKATIDFKCRICEKEDFYIMPLKKKVNNDFVNSLISYNLQCKSCGKNYILRFTIKAI